MMITIVAKDRKSVSLFKFEPFIPTGSTNDFLLFDQVIASDFVQDVRTKAVIWSSTSYSSTLKLTNTPLKITNGTPLKIPNDFPISVTYCALLYAFGIAPLIVLSYFSSYYHFSYVDSLGFLIILWFSLSNGLRSKRYTLVSVRAVRQPFYNIQ